MVLANELTAMQALERMRAGQLSVEEMAQSCLARIRERDPVVKGWVYLDPDLVLRNARELDARKIKGPLHGVPIAVKDVIMTADMPTQHNSPLYAGSFPTVDAGCIKTLRAAGAKGIVVAAFAPGMVTPGDAEAIKDAVAAGVTVVLSTRAGSGVALDGTKARAMGVLTADNLNPQKARLLLALALTVSGDQGEIRRIFATY